MNCKIISINSLNPNKSPGYDVLSSEIIQNVTNETSEPLPHTFNLAFINGNIPDNFKKALISFQSNLKTMNLKIIDPYLFLLVSKNY